MEFSKSQTATLQRAQEEIQDLLLDLHAGTLDRIALEAGLKSVQERLKAMSIHDHRPDPDASHDRDPAPGRGPDRK
jgi:signal transduction histidine kinase